MRVTFCVLLFGFILSGCSKPSAVDGSSAKAFSDSVLAVSRNMPSSERNVFLTDLKTLNAYHGGSGSTLDNPSTELLATVNGKSASAIHAEATEIRATIVAHNLDEFKAKLRRIDEEIQSVDSDRSMQKLVLDDLRNMPISNVKVTNVQHLAAMEIVTSTITFTVNNDTSMVATISDAVLAGKFGASKQTYRLGNDLHEGCFRTFGNSDKGRILPNSKTEFKCVLAGDDLSGIKDMNIVITAGSLNGFEANMPSSANSEDTIAGLEGRLRSLEMEKFGVLTQIQKECSKHVLPTPTACLHQ